MVWTVCARGLGGFYSTYEELKLVDMYIFIAFYVSFYSTYEELKHNQVKIK